MGTLEVFVTKPLTVFVKFRRLQTSLISQLVENPFSIPCLDAGPALFQFQSQTKTNESWSNDP